MNRSTRSWGLYGDFLNHWSAWKFTVVSATRTLTYSKYHFAVFSKFEWVILYNNRSKVTHSYSMEAQAVFSRSVLILSLRWIIQNLLSMSPTNQPNYSQTWSWWSWWSWLNKILNFERTDQKSKSFNFGNLMGKNSIWKWGVVLRWCGLTFCQIWGWRCLS